MCVCGGGGGIVQGIGHNILSVRIGPRLNMRDILNTRLCDVALMMDW